MWWPQLQPGSCAQRLWWGSLQGGQGNPGRETGEHSLLPDVGEGGCRSRRRHQRCFGIVAWGGCAAPGWGAAIVSSWQQQACGHLAKTKALVQMWGWSAPAWSHSILAPCREPVWFAILVLPRVPLHRTRKNLSWMVVSRMPALTSLEHWTPRPLWLWQSPVATSIWNLTLWPALGLHSQKGHPQEKVSGSDVSRRNKSPGTWF